MRIRHQLVANSRWTSGAGNTRTTVTIHQTGNTSRGANAAAHANLQSAGNSRSASWHWTVDDAEAVQSFYHHIRCWHAGNARGNSTSIAVEICVNADGSYARAMENAAVLVAMIIQSEGLTAGDIVQHNHWSGKNCPEQIRRGTGGWTWGHFIGAVVANTRPLPQPEEEDIMATIEDLRRVIREPQGPMYRRTGQEAAWMDLGTCRRWPGRQVYLSTGSPTIIDLDPSDPFWSLPVVGMAPPEGA